MTDKEKPIVHIIGATCNRGLARIALASCSSTEVSQVDTGLVICSIDFASLSESNTQKVHLIPVDENNMVVGVDGRSWKYSSKNILANAINQSLRIPGDYHHASINAANTGVKAPASGWIKPSTLTAEDDGIWGEVEWTEDAACAIRKKEYIYTSPVFTHNKATGEILALKGFALTHYPNLSDLTPVANAQNMEESQMDELLERFRYMLNLPELATPEEVLAEMEKAIARITAMLKSESAEAANSQDTTLIDLLGALETEMTSLAANSQQDLSGYVPRVEFDRVKRSLETITTAAETKRVDTAVNSALEEGIISPASKPWAENYAKNDAEGFADFCANAAQVVPLGEHTHEQTTGDTLSDDEINMCTQLGISQADYKKQKALEV